MRRLRWFLAGVFVVLIASSLAGPLMAQSLNSQQQSIEDSPGYWDDPINWKQQFVPDSLAFWNNSKHWTSNYGPAFRDTVVNPNQMLACSAQFALCFHSGPEPYPCTLSPDGKSANCLCTVAKTINYTLMNAILNYPVYLDTVNTCGPTGSLCTAVDQAPVCKFLPGGALIPGADVLSTFDPESRSQIVNALKNGKASTGIGTCTKGPYAACMTAPCTLNSDGTASCKCPVFNGRFQLFGAKAQCSLGGNLVPSASYVPFLDNNPNQ